MLRSLVPTWENIWSTSLILEELLVIRCFTLWEFQRQNLLLDTLLERLLGSEDGNISLHDLLHGAADLVGALGAVSGADLVNSLDSLSSSTGVKLLVRLARREVVANGVRDGTAEDDKIKKRVGTETVSTVDGDTGGFTASEKTRNDLVLAGLVNSEDLTGVLGGDTTHVVVDGGEDGNGLLGNVDTGEDRGGLRDTGETLVENLSRQVRKLEVDVVLIGTDTTALADLHGHGTADDVARGKILGSRCVTLHEALTLAVEKVSTLTTRALGDQAASAVDTGRVELNELHILVGKTGTGNHGHTVTSASVSRSAREVRTTVATSGKNGVVRAEAVESAILLVVGDHTLALAVLHDQVNGEELNEVVGVVPERLAVKSVQKSVTCAVGGGAAAVGLATLAVVLALTTECTLVNLALVCSREGAAVVLELNDGCRRLSCHVVDGVLVTEPIRTLDGVVHVPSPVVLVHVS